MQIAKNNRINAIDKKRYRIVQSDVFKKIKGKYDYIFANPPYIPTTRKSNIQSSVLAYEPKEALFGGKDGLQYIKKFLAGAHQHLKPGGRIYMEFDGPQKQEIKKIITRLNYLVHKFYQDQHGRFRFVVIENR
jgi:release factor glutamine methyltransferase